MRHAGRHKGLQMAGLAAALIAATASMNVAAPRVRFLPQRHFRHVPVVLIAFDEFPAASLMNLRGRVDSRGFPSFAGLAETSTWYRNTTTVGTFTKEALPAMLTGIMPPSRSFNDPEFFPHNIFTMLGRAFRVHAIAQLPRLCPTLCKSGHHRSEAALPPEYEVFEAGSRGQTFTSFLRLLRPRTKPAFYFAHLVLPHSPWRYLPSAQRYTEEEPIPGEIDPPGRGHGWTGKRWPVAQAWARHLLQTQFTDRLLGLVLDRLKSEGLYDDALVVVTADHGVAFDPGRPARLLLAETAGQLAYVPLFVKSPGQTEGAVSDKPVQTIDVVPTIADELELARTWSDVEGVSATTGDGTQIRHIRDIYFSPEADELRDAVTEKYRVFDDSSGPIDPYLLAPCGLRSLLGTRVEEVESSPVPVTIELDERVELENASPTDLVFPALVSGSVTGAGRRPLVALAVNGAIASVTRASGKPDQAAGFHALMPPTAVASPPNELTAYVVRDCQDPSLVATTLSR
jgi:sulfatase-like protein